MRSQPWLPSGERADSRHDRQGHPVQILRCGLLAPGDDPPEDHRAHEVQDELAVDRGGQLAPLLGEFAILRPSLVMTNVLGATPLAAGLRVGEVVNATGDGRVAFVDPDDIAAVAVSCLLADQAPGTDLVLTGPEALSYAEVCAMVSALLHHPIVHRSVDVDTYSRILVEHGMPALYAPLLAGLDEAISRGSEDRVTDTVQRITGRPPRSFRAFLRDHAAELATAGAPR
jgi:nucleoside-diphosphate-sugar epimerase